MSEIERGRLAYIVKEAMFRRGLRPRYSKHDGGVAFHHLLKDYQAENAALKRECRKLTGRLVQTGDNIVDDALDKINALLGDDDE